MKKICCVLLITLFINVYASNLVESKSVTTKYSKISKAERLKQLTPIQYNVTQNGGTERPFNNPYWNNEAPGIYVDIVSGEVLFSSTDKYDSGTGWPSFTRPIDNKVIITRADNSMFMERTEVLASGSKSHLGHVFDDGPKPTGMRYCMNSAALRFIAESQLKSQGYGQYLYLFSKDKHSNK